MKTSFAVTALILACGLSATASFAADSSPRKNMNPNNMETSPYFAKSAPSVLSRAAVKADLFEAQKSGTVPAMGEGATMREPSVPSSVTRAAVKAEYLQAQKAGTLPPMGERG